jgi:hypothetical protein
MLGNSTDRFLMPLKQVGDLLVCITTGPTLIAPVMLQGSGRRTFSLQK